MGLEENDVCQIHIYDVVSELCNVLVGNLFSCLDKKADQTLGIPQTIQANWEESEDFVHESGFVLDFSAEGQRVRLNIQFNTNTQD